MPNWAGVGVPYGADVSVTTVPCRMLMLLYPLKVRKDRSLAPKPGKIPK